MARPNTRFPTNPAAGGQQSQPFSAGPNTAGGGLNPNPPSSAPAWQQLRDRGMAGQGSAGANRAALSQPQQQPSVGGGMSTGMPGMQHTGGPPTLMDAAAHLPSPDGGAPGVVSLPGQPPSFGTPGQQLGVQAPGGDAGNIDNAISSLRSQLGQANANMPGSGAEPFTGGSPSLGDQSLRGILGGGGAPAGILGMRAGLPGMADTSSGPLGAMPGPSTKFPPGSGPIPPGGGDWGLQRPPGTSDDMHNGGGGGWNAVLGRPGALPTKPIVAGMRPGQSGNLTGPSPGQTGSYLDLLKRRLQGRPGGAGNGAAGLSGLGQTRADGRVAGQQMEL